MTLRLLDDGIAAKAAGHVAECKDSRLAKRFARLQVMLHSSGLAATYLYCIAHKEKGSSDAYAAAANVICEELGIPGTGAPGEVYMQLKKTPSLDVLRITSKVSMVFRWIARLEPVSGPASLATTTDPQDEVTP